MRSSLWRIGERPWPVGLMGLLLLAAMVLRVLVNTDQEHVYRWLGAAAASFLCATLVWAAFLLGSLRRGQPRNIR